MRRPRLFLRARVALIPLAMLLALWLPGANQGAYRVDTGFYAAVGLRAWREGPLWPLMAGDTPYFNKPPLALWIHGLFLHVLGPELWGARLPSLLAAAACVWATMGAARLLAGPRAALIAGCVLALTLEFFRYTRAISLDLWLTLFLMLAVWGAARSVRARSASEGSATGWLVLSGFPLGLALLTKPMAALLAVPIFAAWVVMERGARVRRLSALAGATVLALFIASLWYVPMIARFGDTFIAQHVGRQALERATGESFGPEPWWYYLRLLARTYWPWLLTALAAIVSLTRAARAPDSHAPGSEAGRRRTGRLCLLWCGTWLVALSLFAGKSGRYAVPLYPVLAMLSAAWLAAGVPRPIAMVRRAAVRWLAPAMLAGALVMMAAGVRVHAPAPAHWDDLYGFVREHADEPIRAEREFLWSSANIYLHTGRWPRTVEGTAPPGSIVLFRADGRTPDVVGEVIWRSGPMTAMRVRGSAESDPAPSRSEPRP